MSITDILKELDAIYEAHLVDSFVKKYRREPNEEELKEWKVVFDKPFQEMIDKEARE